MASAIGRALGSSKIVAADGEILCEPNLRDRLGSIFAGGETDTSCLDERAQHRQRETFMARFGHVVDFGGDPRLLRQCAIPRAVLEGKATKFPVRKLEL